MSEKTISIKDQTLRNLPEFTLIPGSKTRCAEYSDKSISGFKAQKYPNGRIFFLQRFTLHGRKGSISLGEFPIIKSAEARERALECKAMVARGEDPRQEKIDRRNMPTLKEFAQQTYLPWAYRHKRSADDDESKLQHHVYKVLGNKQMDSMTQLEIQAFLDQIADSHAASTTNRFRSLLSKMFNMAIELGIITTNPCTYIRKYKEPDFHPVVLTPEETYRLLVALDQDENKVAAAALKILALTGCRRDEILSATWENVDMEKSMLYLPVTKSGKARHVPLSDTVMDILRGIQPVEGSPWVFNGRDAGTRLSDPRKTLWRALERAELPRIRIHALRHGAACAALNHGVDLASIQAMLQHASITTTMRYARIREQTVRTAANAVSDLLTGKQPPRTSKAPPL